MRQVLIIHGYSDSSTSFHPLADFLKANGFDAKTLWLGDYISRDDDVRVADVGKRMEEVVRAKIAAGELDNSFDVIVHSTGGLVVREWLTSYYANNPGSCPMKRLVMLAPANFGSVLAAKGKSFLGRISKGWDNGLQSGRMILNDLELSSPFQWELAQRDVLTPSGQAAGPVFYGAGAVWPFVITGTHPYNGLFRQLVNENGGDGTVRVCAANLNAVGITIDFSDPVNPAASEWTSTLESPAPLAVLPTRTHATIIDPVRSDADSDDGIAETPAQKALLGACILQALNCASYDEYKQIQTSWNDDITEPTAALAAAPDCAKPELYEQYLQANVYVVDDHGRPVEDYFLEFVTANRDSAQEADVYLHGDVIRDVTKNSQSAACRCVFVNRTDLVDNYYRMIPAGLAKTLFLSISAAPPGPNISYFGQSDGVASGSVPIHNEDLAQGRWLKRNSTHFVKIIVPRRPADGVFKLTRSDRV